MVPEAFDILVKRVHVIFNTINNKNNGKRNKINSLNKQNIE